MSYFQIAILALIQGAAELLPVSSSAHVIVAQKLMGLDPSAPEMTFLLVMLHTGTMFAVIAYFWPRWKLLLSKNQRGSVHSRSEFIRSVILATGLTGIVGLTLKKLIEKLLLPALFPTADHAEIEHLFKVLPLIAFSLFMVGLLIIAAGSRDTKQTKGKLTPRSSAWIGIVQGLCLPFRGFSRSGATISTALFCGVPRMLAEDFSFALAVVITPPVILMQLVRLIKHSGGTSDLVTLLTPGLVGMVFAFASGSLALRWLSAWLENGKWKYFGYYCLGAAAVVMGVHFAGY